MMGGMNCPHDGSKLGPELYDSDLKVDRCPKCRGVWLDHDELDAVRTHIDEETALALRGVPDTIVRSFEEARQLREPAFPCPKCARPMERREYGYCSQILIDVCLGCKGAWLDDGELEALESFIAKTEHDAKTLRRGFWTAVMDVVGGKVF